MMHGPINLSIIFLHTQVVSLKRYTLTETEDRQFGYNIILRHIRVTIVAVEKQYVLHILSVYLQLELSNMQSSDTLLYCHLQPLSLYHVFPHNLTNSTIFGKKVIESKMCVLIFFITLSGTFLILRRIQLDVVINVHKYSRKNPAFVVKFYSNLNVRNIFLKNPQTQIFMKICTVGAELFH